MLFNVEVITSTGKKITWPKYEANSDKEAIENVSALILQFREGHAVKARAIPMEPLPARRAG